MINYKERLRSLRQQLKVAQLDAILILDRLNTIYFSGFQGTNSLMAISSSGAYFITDFRYIEEAKSSLSHIYRVMQQDPSGEEFLKKFFSRRAWERIGFESSISYKDHRRLRRAARPARLVEASAIISSLRVCKDSTEIKLIRKAVSIGDKVFARLLEVIRPGLTERQIADWIKNWAQEMGGQDVAFPPIVAAGTTSSRPHYQPGNKKLRKGELILLDFGIKYKGYCSDMTRTVVLGKPNARQRRIYEIVSQAQAEALKSLRPGVKAREVDAVARRIIQKAGYGKNFGHGLGHGLGLEVHEPPALNQQSKEVLKEGMIVTIEPGIYLPGRFGVRIEDMALITAAKPRLLTWSPKHLITI